MKRKKLITVILVVALLSLAYGVVFADTINSVVDTLVVKIASLFDNTGTNITTTSGNQMNDETAQAKQQINNIINSSQSDIQNQLEQYKNDEISKKNQQISDLINQIQASVDAKKAQKLEEYKQKISDSINKEYDKLLNDLNNSK